MAPSAGLYVVGSLVTLGTMGWSVWQLRRYARVDTHPVYAVAVVAAWFMGAVALAVLLPADLATPEESSDGEMVLWEVNYWATFVWSWILCPIMMEFYVAGEFHWKKRLVSAVQHNTKFYLALGALLTVAAIMLAIREGFRWANVSGFLIGAANTYGMVLVVVMLGYGIIEVPREMFEKSDPKRLLNTYYCQAPSMETQLLDAQSDLQELVSQVYNYRCRNENERIHYEMVKKKAELAEAECLADFPSSRFRGRSDDDGGDGERLELMHCKLKKAAIRAERAQSQMQDILAQTVRLESLISRLEGSVSFYHRLDGGDHDAEDLGQEEEHNESLGFTLRYRSRFWKTAAYLTSLFSIILLWNECVSPFYSRASIFSLMIHNLENQVVRFFLSSLPLVYMASCMYTALFKFKLFDSLAIHGNRQTDAYSLLMNASYLGRLQFSLGVNYIGMLHPNDVDHLAFSNLVGDMSVLPFFGTSFNYYLPLVLVGLAGCTMFKLFDRFLNSMGIETHPDLSLLTDRQSKDLITQGQQVVHRNRSRRVRREARQMRSQESSNPDIVIGGGDLSLSDRGETFGDRSFRPF